MRKPIVPPQQLRRRGAESLVTVFLALIFLGMPMVFVLVPLIEVGATIRAARANSQLRARKEKISWAGWTATILGPIFALWTAVHVLFAVLAVMEELDRVERTPVSQFESVPELDLPAEPVVPAPQTQYREEVEKDGRDWVEPLGRDGTKPPSISAVDRLAKLFPYQIDNEPRELEIGTRITGAGLELELIRGAVGEIKLQITNTRDANIAFNVVTSVSPTCAKPAPKADSSPVVLSARDRTARIECPQKGRLRVLTIETMELPSVGMFYVGLVNPRALGSEPRLAPAAGYRTEDPLGICFTDHKVLATEVAPLKSGERNWRDAVDFYARHRCHRYEIPADYHAFTRDNERRLPAAPRRETVR